MTRYAFSYVMSDDVGLIRETVPSTLSTGRRSAFLTMSEVRTLIAPAGS